MSATQKPAYGLLYAILIIVGILAVAAWNHLMGADEGSTPAAQATQLRNAETARETAEPEKAGNEGKDEPAPAAKESQDAAGSDKPAEREVAKDEETR